MNMVRNLAIKFRLPRRGLVGVQIGIRRNELGRHANTFGVGSRDYLAGPRRLSLQQYGLNLPPTLAKWRLRIGIDY